MRPIAMPYLIAVAVAACAAPIEKPRLTTAARVASSFDLWSKSVEVAAANTGWVPGEVHTRIEVRDGDRELETTTEVWSRLSPSGDDDPRSEIVRATENGKDVTERERERARERRQKRDEASAKRKKIGFEFKHPFAPECQDRVEAERTGETRTVRGRPCAGFRWVLEQAEGKVFSGTAWLEQDTGVPVEIQFEVVPLPDRVDALLTRIVYQSSPSGHWYEKEMHIEATGSFLFWTKHIDTSMVFSGHWKKQ